MGTGCSCMTSAPKERRLNIDIPSDQESSDDFVSGLMGIGSASRPTLSNAQSNVILNYTRTLKDRNYLIQMLKATDIPPVDNHVSNTNIYIVLKILDIDTNEQKGSSITSLHRTHTTNPRWNCYRTFKASEFHDKLLFEIWLQYIDDQEQEDCVIGSGEVKISEGFVNVDDHHISNPNNSGQLIVSHDSECEETEEDEQCLREVILHLDQGKYQKTHEIKLYFKLFAMQRGPDATIEIKTMFFISSQSANESLSAEQMKNAMKLNEMWKLQKKDDLYDFLSSQVIYSSPLCSSTQTALLSLLDHPCSDRRGIQFVASLKEIKMDGVDCKTKCDPFQNAMRHMNEYKLLSDTQIKAMNAIHIELNDCSQNQQWWKCCVDTRQILTDFMYFVRYSSENIIICVGHSLWFKAFLKQYVNTKDLTQYTSRHKMKHMMENGMIDSDNYNDHVQNDDVQCFRLNIVFSDQFKNGLEIEDIELLFGDNGNSEQKTEQTEQKTEQ